MYQEPFAFMTNKVLAILMLIFLFEFVVVVGGNTIPTAARSPQVAPWVRRTQQSPQTVGQQRTVTVGHRATRRSWLLFPTLGSRCTLHYVCWSTRGHLCCSLKGGVISSRRPSAPCPPYTSHCRTEGHRYNILHK